MAAEQLEPPELGAMLVSPGSSPARRSGAVLRVGTRVPRSSPGSAAPGEATPKEATPKEALVTHRWHRVTEVLLGDPAVLTGDTAPAPAGGFSLALVAPSAPAEGTEG